MTLEKVFKGKCILITGASGYIASALVPRLHELNAKLILSARSPEAIIRKLYQDLKFDYVDANEIKSTQHAVGECDLLFHLAAQTSIKSAEENPSADFDTNVSFSLSLLRAMEQSKRRPSGVFAGTATVVGSSLPPPVLDGEPSCPETIYDLHKSIVEKYVEYYARYRGVNSLVLRFANIYGPGSTSSAKDRGIFNQIAKKALLGEKISVYGSGEYLRDYVYIDDAARAVLFAAAHANALAGKACFVSTGQGRSIREAFEAVVKQASKITGKVSEIELKEDSTLWKIDKRSFYGDSSFLQNVTGWKPLTDFERGVCLTLKGLS